MIHTRHILSFSLIRICRKTALGFAALIIFGSVFLNSYSFAQSAEEDNTAVSDWLIIPVFYATNRVPDGKNNSLDYLEESNTKGLSFGIKNVACPLPENTQIDDATVFRMQWKKIHFEGKDSRNISNELATQQSIIQNKLLTHDEIAPAFGSYMKQTKSKESLLFVHGCCVDFDKAMERAALLSAHMQVPIAMYDWVSPVGFENYLKNETLVQQTIDGFCRFLNKVEQVTEPQNIILLGHSMGNQFIDQSMVRRFGQGNNKGKNPPFKEIIMANADVDAQSFLNHAKEITANAIITRLYISTKDSRLDGSALAHGRFCRLGSPGNLALSLAATPGLQVVDLTAANSGHNLLYWPIASVHKSGGVGSVNDYTLKPLATNYLKLEATNSVASKESH